MNKPNTANTAPSLSLYSPVSIAFSGSAVAYSTVVQADGKILVGGTDFYTNSFAVARLNADGSVDASFNGTGKVTNSLGWQEYTLESSKMLLQSDNKILMMGGHFDLVRYNSDGSLDGSFGTAGKVNTNFGGIDNDPASALGSALQADGKIVVAGIVSSTNYNNQAAVVRYNSDGSLDTSFNSTGKKLTPDTVQNIASTVAIQQDGKILVGGGNHQSNYNLENRSDYSLIRYNSDGSLDTSFNGAGYVITDLGSTDTITSLLIQADGKILAAGISDDKIDQSTGHIDLIRYNQDGTLDTRFNHTGIVKTQLTVFAYVTNLHNVLLQADGKILVVGSSPANATTSQSYESDVTLLRYNADGSVDTTFGGGDGMVTSPFVNNINGNSGSYYHATFWPTGKF